MQTTIHLTLVWGLLTSHTQITIHVLLRYEVCWQVTRRLQSMSYSVRFVDKLHADYNLCLTPVWGSLTSYRQTTMLSNSGMTFVDRFHADYNPCLTPVWGLLSSYTQIAIHVLLRYEVCWQVTRRLQSMSYSGMRFVDKLHTDYNPCLTLVWGLLTSYTQITIHVLLWYEVCWQVTRRLQSMSYSGMRFVDKIHRLQSMSYSGMRFVNKLHTDYNPCLTPVWSSLKSYTQTTIHVYSGKRFIDKLQADYNSCLTPVWGLLTSYTQTTIHVLLRYEVCW